MHARRFAIPFAINIKVKDLEISHSYSPKEILESNKELRFHFSKLPSDLPDQEIILEYLDKFGEQRQKEMILLSKKHKILEKTS